MPVYPLIDAHEDLAWNMLTFGRDYTLAAHQQRERERREGSLAPQVNGDTLLGWPEYQKGGVVAVFATLFAAPRRRKSGAWDVLTYATPQEARDLYRRQLAAYQDLTQSHPEAFILVTTRREWEAHWEATAPRPDAAHPVALVLLMENAEAIETPEDVAWWYGQGLRIIGPAWTGTRFCGGTREPGPLTDEGRALLKAMAEWHMALDISHMDERAALEALDIYPGPVLASHANPKALVRSDSNRYLTDPVLKRLIERGGTVGIVPFNRFLTGDWRPEDGKDAVSLRRVVEMMDYVCQMAGSARHVGIGSDFDGGFGWQHVPAEVDTIADLQKLAPMLAERGYTEADIRAIFGENWHRLLLECLPQEAPA